MAKPHLVTVLMVMDAENVEDAVWQVDTICDRAGTLGSWSVMTAVPQDGVSEEEEY